MVEYLMEFHSLKLVTINDKTKKVPELKFLEYFDIGMRGFL
jgi:hypothetical protein